MSQIESGLPSPQANPAASTVKPTAPRQRIPMSLPVQKLSVPDLPGYHMHWMLGSPARLQQALAAGYEFVDQSEARVNNSAVGSLPGTDGSTDLGTRISVVAGGDPGADGQAQRLYLMKIKLEWWNADQAVLEERNEQVAKALRGGKDVGANPNGSENRYIPTSHAKAVENLFTPKIRRS